MAAWEKGHGRILAAATVGTAVEFYDFFIYATAAALVFGPLFFPSESAAAQTLAALVSFGIAFFARPVGAMLFGHYGDRIGRKSTLVASLLMMGGATFAIAFLPTYAMVGWIAPALLSLCRFIQGFALGGEWGGAALLAVEYAPADRRSRYVSIMQMGSPIGFMAATGVFMTLDTALSEAQFMAWGWRLPFLLSALLVLVGLWVRLKIEETPAFKAVLSHHAVERAPLTVVLRQHMSRVLAGAGGVVATFALFYLSTAYALAVMTGPLGYAREPVLSMQLLASLFYAAGLWLAGTWGDRHGPAWVLIRAGAATVVIGLLFDMGLRSGGMASAATLSAAMFALGLANAPLGSWLSTLFPAAVRYSGLSMAFNLGGIIGGALTPIAAQMLGTAGWRAPAGGLLILAGLCTMLAVAHQRRAVIENA